MDTNADTSADTAPAQQAGGREWAGLAVLALPTLLLSLDLSVLYLALPSLSADLNADSTQQLWITDIYGFMVAGFLITMGTLGDRIGRRRLLMIGAAAFAAASVAAAFSTSPEMLIASRAALGIAGATLGPSALALATGLFKEPKQQAVAISVMMSCFMGGNALGPLLGGVLLEFFWWGSVFLLGVPVMVLLLATGPALLPEYRDPNAGRLDPLSVVLSLAAILPAVYGLKELATDGWETPPLAALVAGIVFGVAFVRRQGKLADPLLDLRLFHNRTFSTVLAITLCGAVFLGGTTLLVTQWLQLVEALSPLQAGLWLMPAVLAMVVGAMAAPNLAQRIRPAYIIGGGMGIAALGYVVITQVDNGSLGVLVVGWTIALFGNGLPAGLGVALIMGSVPPEKAGSASSVSETNTEFGIALGLAVVGSIGAAVYRGQLEGSLPPGIPTEAAQAARESVNGALAVAQQLPQLLDPARAAYTAGLNVAAALSAAVFAGLAVIAAILLRQIPAFGAAQQEQAGGAGEAEETDEAASADTAPAATR